jgi:CO/xanthine dehydrogenase Mo-binding subunit
MPAGRSCARKRGEHVQRHASRQHLRQNQPVRQWAESARFDAVEKATGRAQYIDDFPAPSSTLYAAPVLSTHRHADIVDIDASATLALPGVVTVFDRNHLHGIDPTCPVSEYLGEGGRTQPGEQRMLTVDRARFEGDLLGMVLGIDKRSARAGAKAMQVQYNPLPIVDGWDSALAQDASQLHEAHPGNIAFEDEFAWGDVEAGLLEAPFVTEEEFWGANAFHRPLEPSTSCLALPVGDELTIWTSSHRPMLLAAHVAHILGLPERQIRVRTPYIGGGFGAKQITPHVVAASSMAWALQTPVKYLANDHESFHVTSRHAITYRARIGCDEQGNIIALDVDLEVDTGAYFTGVALVTHNACISAWGSYRIPNFRVRAKAVYTNKVPSASFRATGKNQTTFGVECLMDAAAAMVGQTPWEFRKRNVVRRGEFPAENWRVRGKEYVADVPPMDTDFVELINAAMAGIDWDPERPLPPPADDCSPALAPVRGRGLALSLRHGAQGGGRAYAMVQIDPDGMVSVQHNAPDLGTGVYTVLAVVASEALGIPRDRVYVPHPDTANGLTFGGTSAQRTTVQMGNAVQRACKALEADLIETAVQVIGGETADWSYDSGKLSSQFGVFSLADIVGGLRGSVTLSAVGSYGYAPSQDTAFGGLDHWAPGAAAAEVEIDRNTGEVRVLRYCAVADAGKAIHHTSAVRQVEGGAIMGLGLTLFEELKYDENSLENGNGWYYRIPTIQDLPTDFQVVLVENGDGPGPFGAKGIAQTSLPCVAPAIGNAIREALGYPLREVPFTAERVLTALRFAEETR